LSEIFDGSSTLSRSRMHKSIYPTLSEESYCSSILCTSNTYFLKYVSSTKLTWWNIIYRSRCCQDTELTSRQATFDSSSACNGDIQMYHCH